MTEIENIVLEHLCHMRGALDSVREDIREIKGVWASSRVNTPTCQYAHMSNRIDRLDARVERIEQRLELTEV